MLEPPIKDKGRWWNQEDVFVLILFGVLFFFPGLGQIPLFDRDEPRFATATREMITSQNYLIPHFNGYLRPDKPPLLYWLMATAYNLFGGPSEFAARLPSALCSTLTLLVVYFMVGSRFGRLTGILASLILGSCAVFVVESRLATADATMLFFIMSCMACAWQAWDAGAPAEAGGKHLPRTDYLLDRGGRDGQKPLIMLDHLPASRRRKMPFPLALLFWMSLAGGALVKGVPLIFVFVPMIALSLGTGALPSLVRHWRKHLHVTRARMVVALVIAAIASAVLVGTVKLGGYSDLRWWTVIFSLLFMAMVLTPGLPGVLVRCFTGGNWGWWKQLRPWVGVPLLLILIGAWAVPAGLQSPALLERMVGIHFLQRVAGPLLERFHITFSSLSSVGGNDAVETYAKPPGTYLLLVWATFWPWSVLLIPAAFHAVRRVLGRSAIAIDPRPYQFLLAWIVPMWVLLELARGKLPHYPLPTYVGISILCADALVQGWHRLSDVLAPRWFAEARWVVLVIWCALAIGALYGANRFLSPDLFYRTIPFAGALLAVGVAGTIAWNRPSWPFVTALAWGGALLLLNTLILPEIPALQVSKAAGARMAELQGTEPDFHFAAIGDEEPTLVFYAGGHVDMFEPLKWAESPAEYAALPASLQAQYRHVTKVFYYRNEALSPEQFAGLKDSAQGRYHYAADAYVYDGPFVPTWLKLSEELDAHPKDPAAHERLDTAMKLPVMLATVPFAPDREPTKKFVVAIDEVSLGLLKELKPELQYTRLLPSYRGIDVANFRPLKLWLITNVLPKEDVIATQPATAPATQAATAPAR